MTQYGFQNDCTYCIVMDQVGDLSCFHQQQSVSSKRRRSSAHKRAATSRKLKMQSEADDAPAEGEAAFLGEADLGNDPQAAAATDRWEVKLASHACNSSHRAPTSHHAWMDHFKSLDHNLPDHHPYWE